MSARQQELATPISRTRSEAAATGPEPAAPLKFKAKLDSFAESASAVDPQDKARNLLPEFAAVADNLLAEDAAGEANVAATESNVQDSTESHSLSVPLEQAPVQEGSLPELPVSARAKVALANEDLQYSKPGEKSLREEPAPLFSSPEPSPAAKAVRGCNVDAPPQPATPDNTPDSVPSRETLLGMGYSGATLPQDEAERLRTVALLGILDQPEDPVLSSITKLVARLLKVSTVGVNIIDRDRLWWPSISTSSPLPEYGWTHPRQIGFCAYTLLSEAAEVLVVEDASKDHRFKDSPFVTGFPHIRFYGGAPLIASNGHRIGALCAIDQEPRKLSTQQLSILANLAEMVVRRIERDKQILIQQHSKTSLLRTLRNQQEAVFMCDTAMSGWPVLFTNKSCQDMLEWNEGTLGGRGVWDVFRINDASKEAAKQALSRRTKFSITASATKFPTHARQLQLEFRPANQPTAIHPSLQIGIPAFISDKEDQFQLYFVTVTPVAQVTTAPARLQPNLRPISENHAVDRPSDAWAKHMSAPGYASFPSDIRHTKTRQALAQQGNTLKPTPDAFEEVQVGVLIGGSSSGNVYRGMWRSIPVCVKKTRARLSDCVPMGEEDSLITQEAAIAVRVTHPHIVTTYKYAIKYSEKQQQQPPFPRGSRGFLENGGRASEDTHPQISVDNQGRVSMEKNTAATEGRMAPDKGRAASQDSPAPDNKAVPVGRTDPVKAGESFEKKSGMAECWLFMELCNKGTLQHAMNNGWLQDAEGKSNLVNLLSSVREASLGMAQLHREDIIHGALCPAACFLKAARNQRGFVVKVGDMGRSSMQNTGSKLEVRRAVRYISPESICTGYTSKEFDVYSFGIMLYELYTCKPAFASISAGDIITAKLQNDHVISLPQTAPQALQDLVTQCVSHDARARPKFPQIAEALMNIRDSVVAAQTPRPERALSAQPESVGMPVQHSSSLHRENSVPVTRGGIRNLVTRSASRPRQDSPRDCIPAWDPDAQSALELQSKKQPVVMPEEGIIAGPDEVGGNIQEQGRKGKTKNPCVPQFWKPSNMCCAKTRTKSFMDEPAANGQDRAATPAPQDVKTSLRVKNFCFEQSRNVLLLCK